MTNYNPTIFIILKKKYRSINIKLLLLYNLSGRDAIFLKNIILTLTFQIFASFSTIFITPLALGFINAERFGLWLVISSIFSWISLLNLGLGSGLRNKLAVYLSKKDYKLSQELVSTTYFFVSIIAFFVICFFIIAHNVINWSQLFNADCSLKDDLDVSIVICATSFTIRFIVNIILSIIEADQKVGLTKVFPCITNVIIVITLALVKYYSQPSLTILCLIMVIPEVAVYIIANLILFRTKYAIIAPSISGIKFRHAIDLMGIGLKFFIIQIAMIILFSTDNIIITRLFNPSIVTPYNVAMQYMGYASTIFYLLLSPSLSAFAEAHAHKDNVWIIKTLKRQIKLWVGLSLILFIMTVVSNEIYDFWIGPEIEIPITLTMLMALFTSLHSWNSIFGNYNTGIGKINMIMVICLVIIVINIPLSIYFATDLGLESRGVIFASIVCILLGSIFAPIQSYLLITGKARGLWNS
ncbi:MAG TPA: hypothetical protein PK859_12380 [Spirochaetota bacterium]|nr:hypothetical protein [Spirochaetota bacterium]